MSTFRIAALVLSTALAVSCSAIGRQYDVRVSGVDLHVEVVDTEATRERGLMERKTLDETSGMLFVFDDSQPRVFWMKDTPLPLSIAYIDDNLVIREILDMRPLSIEPVPSREPARYALEMNQGAFQKLGIRVGSRLVPSSALARRLGL